MNVTQNRIYRELHTLADDIADLTLRRRLHGLAEQMEREFQQQRNRIRGPLMRRLRRDREAGRVGAAREADTTTARVSA